MKFLFAAAAAPALVAAQGDFAKGAWDYLTPDTWGHAFPACGTGAATESQSPIDLPATAAPGTYPPLEFVFDPVTPTNAEIINNGHSIQLGLAGGAASFGTYTGGALAGPYSLVQLHFHWGSEHTIEGHRPPLEMHMVHYNTAYPTIGEAVDKPEGLAVMGVFFDEGPENAELQKIFDAVPTIADAPGTPAGSTPVAVEIDLNALLPPTAINSFVTYPGSLTTPPCFESVVWTLATERLTVSKAQIKLLQMLRDSHNHRIDFNWRPVQPLNGRVVEASGEAAHGGGDAAHSKSLWSNAGVIFLEVVGGLMLLTLMAYCSRGFIMRVKEGYSGSTLLTDEMSSDEKPKASSINHTYETIAHRI